jgi:hypothetical protein
MGAHENAFFALGKESHNDVGHRHSLAGERMLGFKTLELNVVPQLFEMLHQEFLLEPHAFAATHAIAERADFAQVAVSSLAVKTRGRCLSKGLPNSENTKNNETANERSAIHG